MARNQDSCVSHNNSYIVYKQNILYALLLRSINWLCVTVALCSNGAAGPSDISPTHLSHHCIPSQRASLQSTTDSVSC